MSADKARDPGARLQQVSFFVGLALIGLATIQNIGYDGLSQADRLTLPQYVADTYDRYGKGGVTTFFVSLGLTVIVAGFVTRMVAGRYVRRGGWVAGREPSRQPWSKSADAQEQHGSVSLNTQKYMGWSQRTVAQRWETAES